MIKVKEFFISFHLVLAFMSNIIFLHFNLDINIASNKNKTENPKTKTVTRKATLKLNADRYNSLLMSQMSA